MNLKLNVEGINELEMKISTLERASVGVAKMCLYEGAKVVADNLRAAVSTIPTEAHHAVPNATNGRQLVYMTPEEKVACLAGIGIATFDGTDDSFTTAIGFNGYQNAAGEASERHPYGIPVPMLMYSLENGTSVRKKYPVCRKAFKASEGAALSAMQAKFAELVDKIMK